MDMNKDAKLNYEEFKEGSKQDPTIVQVSTGWSSIPRSIKGIDSFVHVRIAGLESLRRTRISLSSREVASTGVIHMHRKPYSQTKQRNHLVLEIVFSPSYLFVCRACSSAFSLVSLGLAGLVPLRGVGR